MKFNKMMPSVAKQWIDQYQKQSNNEPGEFYLIRLSGYLNRLPDNSEKEFKIFENDWAKEMQEYFPNYLTNRVESSYFQFLQRYIDFLNQPIKSKSKLKKATAPTIGLFCYLLNKLNIENKGNQSSEDYCKFICGKYKLSYSDRVRQNYFDGTTKHRNQLKKLIFPNLEPHIKVKIENYLDTKYPNEQNLYG